MLFATANAAVVLSLDEHGALRVSRHSDGRWYGIADTEPLAQKRWYHVAVTCDGKALALYRDVVPRKQADAPGSGSCGQVSIGYSSVTGGSFYHGLLDEVRISATVLKPEESGPHTPQAAGLR